MEIYKTKIYKVVYTNSNGVVNDYNIINRNTGNVIYSDNSVAIMNYYIWKIE